MIPRIEDELQTSNWQIEMAEAVRDPLELLRLLEIAPEQIPACFDAHRQFPTRVPLSFVSRIKKGEPNDPLLRQVLPVRNENEMVEDYGTDPVGDAQAEAQTGLLQKYTGRQLLIATGACAIHCRYCFRRHYPYGSKSVKNSDWLPILSHIRDNSTVHEVILSGGDPLNLSDSKLREFVQALEKIEHVHTLRIHTRTAVVIPSRVNQPFLDWLGASRLNRVIVFHVNHAQEIDAAVRQAVARLRQLPLTLLNQSVLLAGVNDKAEVLEDLSQQLFSMGILPYYLHLLDKVRGAHHFNVPENRALELIQQLRSRLPGYLVPRLVREDQGATAKTLIR